MLTRCTKCVMPTTRPDTAFIDGVCSACINFLNRPQINWAERQAELVALLEKYDGRCIVPSSGGKDSTYQTLRLIELGAKPIVVTATTCDLTAIGRANIDNLSRFATTIEVTPNRSVRKKLNRLSLEMVGDPSWPEHVTIHSVPFRIAKQLGIHLMFYGECPNADYGGPIGSESTRVMTQRWASEFAGYLGLRASDFVGMDGITERDMEDYTAPTDEALQDADVTAYFLGQIEPWDSHRNGDVAMANGMLSMLPSRANWWKFENLDNLQVSMHDAMMFYKYGYGRLCAQISVDIRNGLIERDAALNVVNKRDGAFPSVYLGCELEDILARIHVTPDRYLEICNQFLNRDIFAGDVEWGERPAYRVAEELV